VELPIFCGGPRRLDVVDAASRHHGRPRPFWFRS
jgi:hypothetical protein